MSIAEYPGVSTEIPTLLERHLSQLRDGSGLSLDVIRERGYRSVVAKPDLEKLGFGQTQCLVPGLLLPVCTTDGHNTLHTFKPDSPRKNRDGKPRKYELPWGSGARLDVPPRCLPSLKDPSVPLWVTEGQKKADALAVNGLCAVALLGVEMFKGKNDQGGITFLADWDYIALNGRTVHICFDSDVMVKPSVARAMKMLTEHLSRRKATVRQVYLPDGPNGAKVGADDYLLTHSVDELKAVANAAPPVREAEAPHIELLDMAPALLTKPLQLVDGHAYVTTWLWLRRTITETREKDGRIVTHNPPLVETARELFVLRDDGVIYGTGGTPIEELGFDVRLGDPPPGNRCFSSPGVKTFISGQRPNVSDVLTRVTSVFDHYLDFGRSIGTQEQMCRFSACLTIATWFTDAYTVQGYPWPNGEKGCGKTKYASLWAAMGYLGMMVTAGGSFAALRDLAEYGAALAFDDAENLNDPKKTDPDKRALLLAGNRKGVQIPLKEQQGDKWVTRWVNAYAPRAFTAINMPDDVLNSRSIVIPLVRTGDGTRANRDPAKANRWPCDAGKLVDDLWSMALWLLPEAEQVWNELDDETDAVGRDLEPWRASLATARLIERHGVEGLEADVRTIMKNYFEERGDSVTGDRQRAVVLAIVRHVEAIVLHSLGLTEWPESDTLDTLDTMDTYMERYTFSATDIQTRIKTLASLDAEDGEESASWATPTAIGLQLSKLRLERERTKDTKRSRRRQVSLAQLQGLAAAFNVRTPLVKIPPPQGDVSNVSNVSNVSTSTPLDLWDQGEAEQQTPPAKLTEDIVSKRTYVLQVAEGLGWPTTPYRQGQTIFAGAGNWQLVVRWADIESLNDMLAALGVD